MSKIWESECPAIDKETEPRTQTNSNTHSLYVVPHLWPAALLLLLGVQIGWRSCETHCTSHLHSPPHPQGQTYPAVHQLSPTLENKAQICFNCATFGVYSWDNTVFDNMTMTFKRYKKA